MEIQKINFPSILPENEQTYFRYLEGVISSVDNDASVQVIKKPSGISVRIYPYVAGSFSVLLQEIKRLHTKLGLQVEFSKSMRIGINIYFDINF